MVKQILCGLGVAALAGSRVASELLPRLTGGMITAKGLRASLKRQRVAAGVVPRETRRVLAPSVPADLRGEQGRGRYFLSELEEAEYFGMTVEDPDGENDGRTVVPRSTTPRGSKRPRANTADEDFMSMMAVFVEHTKMKMAMLTKSLESETPSTSKSDDEALVEMVKMQDPCDTIVKKIQDRTDAALERIERRMEERMAAQQEVLERLAAAILK